jgi:type III pantothenate kinase
VHTFRVESVRGRTADELAVTLLALLSMHGVSASSVDAAILACVVPSLTEPMVRLVRNAFGRDTMVVGPGLRTGMAILIENPREVGADRIADAVAGYEKTKGGVVVVDFGTSTNFDVVTPKGEYLGGVLAPGLQISADALFARAAKLPRVEIVKPPRVVGRNTVHAMQSGIVYGYVALVDGLVDRILAELGYPCAVIATGGLASLIAPLSKTINEVDDKLTLVGLRILYERNRV